MTIFIYIYIYIYKMYMFCKQNRSNGDCSLTRNRKLNNDERTGVSMHRYAVKRVHNPAFA